MDLKFHTHQKKKTTKKTHPPKKPHHQICKKTNEKLVGWLIFWPNNTSISFILSFNVIDFEICRLQTINCQ